jgi:hypothetical protein
MNAKWYAEKDFSKKISLAFLFVMCSVQAKGKQEQKEEEEGCYGIKGASA